jgi:hypothetical protein
MSMSPSYPPFSQDSDWDSEGTVKMKVSGSLYPWCSRTDWVWASPLRSTRGALQQLGRGLTSPTLSTLAPGLLGNAARPPPKKAHLPFKTTVAVARSPRSVAFVWASWPCTWPRPCAVAVPPSLGDTTGSSRPRIVALSKTRTGMVKMKVSGPPYLSCPRTDWVYV